MLRASALLFEFHLRVNAVRTVRRKPCGMRSFSLASELRGKEPPSSKVLALFREPPSPSPSTSLSAWPWRTLSRNAMPGPRRREAEPQRWSRVGHEPSSHTELLSKYFHFSVTRPPDLCPSQARPSSLELPAPRAHPTTGARPPAGNSREQTVCEFWM